jgi:hypothetical protein
MKYALNTVIIRNCVTNNMGLDITSLLYTALQLELITTANTLISLWMTSTIWRNFYCRLNLGLVSSTPWIQSPSQSYITTDSQSASLSLNKAPICGLQPYFINVRLLRVCLYGALSLTRGHVCRLLLLLDIASAVILGSEFRGTRDHILLSQIRDSNKVFHSINFEGLSTLEFALSHNCYLPHRCLSL